jgi:predicted Rossmann-fold nucleotide-binding protein
MTEAKDVDLHLAAYPEDRETLSLTLPDTHVNRSVIDGLESNDGSYTILGRSVLGQLGVDIRRIKDMDLLIDEGELHIPIDVLAYNATGRAIEADVREIRSRTEPADTLRWHGRPLNFGRMVNFENMKQLNKEEMQQAIDELYISFGIAGEDDEPDYQIDDNGAVTLPLGMVEFVFNPKRLARPEQRFNAIKHGRAGLIPHMDAIRHREEDPLPDFLVGGIILSTGPYHWKIKEVVDERVRQLPSAARLDGNRLMGISSAHDDYSRHRQVELVNRGKTNTFGNTRVTLEAFRSTAAAGNVNPTVNWWQMNRNERKRLHAQGVNPLDVIMATNPSMRETLLEAVSGEKTGAVVLSAHGATAVERGETDKFTFQNILDAARSFGRDRNIPKRLRKLRPFVELLKPAADRSRLVVADRLLAEDIPAIVEGGDVRAFLLQDFGPEAMTKEIHSALVEQVRNGVSIGWVKDGNLRHFHRSGLWVKPEAVSRMEDLDLVVAMYGGHKEVIGSALNNQIDEFFGNLKTLMPAYHIGVAHGNGPGVMDKADYLSRKHGMMSIGVGIDVEEQTHGKANMEPQAVATFKTDERLYRQQMLDTFNTIPIFNVGGFGTLEELAISVCTHKLLSCVPTPKIIVDPDKLYTNATKLYDEISNRPAMTINGQTIDLKDPANQLGQSWVSKTVHRVENYQQAFEKIKEFYEDPQKYWREAGIPQKEIERALRNHTERLRRVGMRPAEIIRRAAEAYILDDDEA